MHFALIAIFEKKNVFGFRNFKGSSGLRPDVKIGQEKQGKLFLFWNIIFSIYLYFSEFPFICKLTPNADHKHKATVEHKAMDTVN